jgi:hypothetical protein
VNSKGQPQAAPLPAMAMAKGALFLNGKAGLFNKQQ